MRKRLKWQRPNHCPPIACCPEVAKSEARNVLIRSSSSKRRRVEFTPEEWASLITAVKAGEYDQVGTE